MPVWLNLTIKAPPMSEPPEASGHVRLDFLSRPREKRARAYLSLRSDYDPVRLKPPDIESVVCDAYREGRPVRVEIVDSSARAKSTRVDLHLEIDTQ